MAAITPQSKTETTRLRLRLYQLLESGQSGAALYLRWLLGALIIANIGMVVLESDPVIQVVHSPWLYGFEWFSVGVFTLEYILRLWVCVEAPGSLPGWSGRWRYAVRPMSLIDFLAFAPFYLHLVIGIDTRVLRAFRLLRVFKLSRHSSSMDLLLTVLRQESQNFLSTLFIMLVLIVLAASGIHIFEKEAQPETFGTIPRAMWWATVTLTTVGYGDVVPQTVGGKIFGVAITMVGVGIVALPAGIIASGFSAELSRRRKTYQQELDVALADGRISASEQDHLSEVQAKLGLSDVEVEWLRQHYHHPPASPVAQHCPHCGQNLELNSEHDGPGHGRPEGERP